MYKTLKRHNVGNLQKNIASGKVLFKRKHNHPGHGPLTAYVKGKYRIPSGILVARTHRLGPIKRLRELLEGARTYPSRVGRLRTALK